MRTSVLPTMLVGFILIGLFSASNGLAQSVPGRQSPAQVKKIWQAKLSRLTSQLEKYVEHVGKLSVERDVMSQRLTKLNVTEASFSEVMRLLQTQRVQLIIDLAGLDARQKAIIEMQKEKRASADNSDAKELLEKIVSETEQNMAVVDQQYKQGVTSVNNYQKARLQMLEARLRLAEFEQASASASESTFLTDASIERVEKQARLTTVESLLKQYYEARQSIEELKQLDKQYEIALQHRIDAELELNQAQMEFDYLVNEND